MFVSLVDRFIPPEHLATAESTRQARLAVGTYLVVAVFNAYYALLSLLIVFPGGIYSQVPQLLVSVACLLLFRMGTRPDFVAALFFSFAIVAISIATYFSGGFTSPVLPWLATSPIVALLVTGRKGGLLTLFGALAALGFFFVRHLSGIEPQMQVRPEYRDLFTVSTYAGLVLIVYVIAAIFQHLKESAFSSLRLTNEELERAVERLRSTQKKLVQQEKLASLGRITAGIAHELKNPLNFVNNFADLSGELIQELFQERRKKASVQLSDVEDVLSDLQTNVEKIAQHGRRADGIVRSMLDHSRARTQERRAIDINALVDEYVDLAYHGMRSQTPDFTCEVVRRFDESAGKAEVEPQEIGRVLLNVLNNAFYAVHERNADDAAFRPEVTVSTHRDDEHIEIEIADNGPGIPEEIREKIFEPFYTTKPTGSGTGLGLSLSYDIVVQGHGGKISCSSDPGLGTVFTIALPTGSS